MREERLPPHAASQRDHQVRECGKRCHWCFTLNLLAGDFEPLSLFPLFSPEEMETLREQAEILRHERLHRVVERKRLRGRREKREEPVQGVLL